MPKKTKPLKPRFEPVLIIGGKRHRSSNARNRKRDESQNEERNLGRKVKKLNDDINKKYSCDASQFLEKGLYMQFQSLSNTIPEEINLPRTTRPFAHPTESPLVILDRLLNANLIKRIPSRKIDWIFSHG